MIENFRVVSPCQTCGAMKPCEATEDECYELRLFLECERREDINESTETETK